MYIKKFGVKYAILDRNNTEVCRFNRLADACIVQRYLSNQSLPEPEEKRALQLLRMFDENGGGRVDSRRKEKEADGIPAELAKAEQG